MLAEDPEHLIHYVAAEHLFFQATGEISAVISTVEVLKEIIMGGGQS